MIFITGGAWQGKTAYAKKKYGLTDADIFDGGMPVDFVDARLQKKDGKRKCINRYHLLVKQLCETGEDALAFTDTLLQKHPDLIVLMDEIGNGIIPLEKSERLYREQVGKTGCLLAREANTVVRLVCGLPTELRKR